MKVKKRRLIMEIAAPEYRTEREQDAALLETLATVFEYQELNHGTRNQFSKDPWSLILRRYLADEYPRADKTGETANIARHVWLRQTVFEEKLEASAAEVAGVLKRAGINKSRSTVLSIAKRAENKRQARNWIAVRFRQYRKDHTRESIAQALLERFEPGENAELVQRALASLHPGSCAK